jgi:hypothetical protein
MPGGPERAFLLSSLPGRELDVGRLRALAAGGLDWAALEATARATGVVQLLANALESIGPEAPVPAGIADRLRGALEQNAARNALLASDLRAIDAALRAAGIEAVVLKGAALVALDADYAPLRAMSDVDLLVPAGAAADVLAALRRSAVVAVGGPDPRLEQSPHPHVVVTRSGVPVELHVRLGDPPARGAARAGAIRAGSTRSNRLGVRIPSTEDLLGIAAWHALVHHRHDLAHRPRLVADLHLLLALGADAAVAAARHDTPAEHPVADALALLESARVAAAHPSRFGTLAAEQPLSPARRAIAKARGAWRSNTSRLLRAPAALFFPPRRFMAARYGVPERSPLLPLLYLYRPLRGLFRSLTGK